LTLANYKKACLASGDTGRIRNFCNWTLGFSCSIIIICGIV